MWNLTRTVFICPVLPPISWLPKGSCVLHSLARARAHPCWNRKIQENGELLSFWAKSEIIKHRGLAGPHAFCPLVESPVSCDSRNISDHKVIATATEYEVERLARALAPCYDRQTGIIPQTSVSASRPSIHPSSHKEHLPTRPEEEDGGQDLVIPHCLCMWCIFKASASTPHKILPNILWVPPTGNSNGSQWPF